MQGKVQAAIAAVAAMMVGATSSALPAMAENIGVFTKTKVIFSGQICNGPDCDGFTFIKCSKQP